MFERPGDQARTMQTRIHHATHRSGRMAQLAQTGIFSFLFWSIDFPALRNKTYRSERSGVHSEFSFAG